MIITQDVIPGKIVKVLKDDKYAGLICIRIWTDPDSGFTAASQGAILGTGSTIEECLKFFEDAQ